MRKLQCTIYSVQKEEIMFGVQVLPLLHSTTPMPKGRVVYLIFLCLFYYRRLYCNNCLVKLKEIILCNRCVIFKTRPVKKIELLKLKTKDLIFYLQSKHISTTGCVEKEELVNLVLSQINSEQTSPTNSSGSSSQRNGGGNSDPFDSLKQTCQNLFSSFTDKLATEISFDVKTNQYRNNYHHHRHHDLSSSRSRRPSKDMVTEPSPSGGEQQVTSPSTSTPTTTASSSSSVQSPLLQNQQEVPLLIRQSSEEEEEGLSRGGNHHQPVPSTSGQNLNNIRPTTTTTTTNGNGRRIHHSDDDEDDDGDGDGESSSTTTSSPFEELGAIGGADDVDINWPLPPLPSTATATSRKSNSPHSSRSIFNAKNRQKLIKRNLLAQQIITNSAIDLNNSTSSPILPQRRITRRRSDTCIVLNQLATDDDDDDGDDATVGAGPMSSSSRRKRTKKCCDECGKTTIGIKLQVSRFRHQLESSNMTEAEKKKRLNTFLRSLENRCSGGGASRGGGDDDDDDCDRFTNEMDGIHVYPTGIDELGKSQINRGRLKLNDISSR